MKHYTLQIFQIKNCFFRCFPSILILCILSFIFIKYPVFSQLTSTEVSSLQEISENVETGNGCVKLSVSSLTFTGYAYKEKGSIKGGYYYTFLENKCLFVLVKNKELPKFIENSSIKGKVEEGGTIYQSFVSEFSKDSALESEALSQIALPYYINEIHYPYFSHIATWCILLIPLLLSTFNIFLSFYYYFHPEKSTMGKNLSSYGDISYYIKTINMQCYHSLVYRNTNILITDDYMIYTTLTDTIIIKIAKILYISKHILPKKKWADKLTPSYKLTLSDHNEMLNEFIFHDEKEIDEIMNVLITLCPNIDNKTLEYWK